MARFSLDHLGTSVQNLVCSTSFLHCFYMWSCSRLQKLQQAKQQQQKKVQVAVVKPIIRSPASKKPTCEPAPTRDHAPQPHPPRLPSIPDIDGIEDEASQVRWVLMVDGSYPLLLPPHPLLPSFFLPSPQTSSSSSSLFPCVHIFSYSTVP